jgi:hypothetical protein
MKEENFIPVGVARERLGLSPREMLMLLEADALHYFQDPFDKTIRWVHIDAIRDAEEHLTKYRQEEKERLARFSSPSENESREVSFFTISDTDLLTLLLASISYFDAERDIYFRAGDERDNILKFGAAAVKIYERLEEGTKAGHTISEIVDELYEKRPDREARDKVFLYLIDTARQKKKQS